MTRRQTLLILADRLADARAARDHAAELFSLCEPDLDAIDDAYSRKIATQARYVAGLELFVRAWVACEESNLEGQLEAMVEAGAWVACEESNLEGQLEAMVEAGARFPGDALRSMRASELVEPSNDQRGAP